MLRIFIDESGTAVRYNPNKNNSGERFFTLAAVIIEKPQYNNYKAKLKQVRKAYKKYIGENEIKSRNIRRSNPVNVNPDKPPIYDFWKYGESGIKKYQSFATDVKQLVKKTDFQLISVTVDKLSAQNIYPDLDVRVISLSDLWERIFIYHVINDIKKSRIMFDPKMNLDDSLVKQTYESFISRGSWYIDNDRLKMGKLYNRVFLPSSEESMGIQLADYCAYPIKRYVEDDKYQFFKDMIKPKLHQNVVDQKTKKTVYLGLKVSLSR